jgi:DNA-directed RNA polymerase subunit RPC12/RpoP
MISTTAWVIIAFFIFSILGVYDFSSTPDNYESSLWATESLPAEETAAGDIQIGQAIAVKTNEYTQKFDYKIDSVNRHGSTWDIITLSGGSTSFLPWLPEVPVKSMIFDTDSEIAEIEVSYFGADELLDFRLPPAQEPEFIIAPELALQNEINTQESSIDQQIDDYLNLDFNYPEYDYLLSKIDIYEDNGIIQNKYSLQLYPCKYNPKLRTAEIFNEARVKIYYFEQPSTGSRSGEKVNSEELAPEEEVPYLILTTEPLMDELTPLASWKIRKGLPTKIVDVNRIYENETFDGFDEPEEIRNYIRYMHEEYLTEYVLLAGDWDTVPPRMCHDPDPYSGADDGEIPADSYYACISADSTWDEDNDHIYGELGDLDDIYPDIVVGRIAINSEAKMEAWVSEVLNYEQKPIIEEWTGKVILLGPNVHNEGDGAEQSEYFHDKYLKYVYESFDKYYESSDAGEPFSRSEIIKSINQGATFLNYLGHGGPSTWTYNYGYNKLIDKSDVNRFTNGRLKPVVYAMSCLTEWFDDPSDSGYGNFGDCIGETFTENVDDAGIGYIGSARTSVGSVGSGYGPFATGLQEDFIRQLSQNNFVLGEAYTEGKKHYSESFGHMFPDTRTSGEVQACWLEVNLLGEPELPLWTSTPKTFNVTNSSVGDFLTLVIKNETGSPIEGAQVCIQSSSRTGTLEALRVKLTSVDGNVVFDITNLPVRLNLTITKINYVPYLEKITIRDTISPETTLEVIPNEPDGENGWWDDINNSNNSIIFNGPVNVPEGMHTLYYYSVDIANNIELTKKYDIKVDLTTPFCNLLLQPETPDGYHGWFIHQPMINFSTEANATVYYAFNDDYYLKFIDLLLSPEGVHDLNYYSRDDAGNIGNEFKTTLKVDITPPKTILNINPDVPTGKNGWYAESPLIHLTTENNGSSFYYWDDDGINASILYTEPISVQEGIHRLYYYSVDFAGCPEKVNNYLIKLDTIAPTSTHTLYPSEADGENGYYRSDVIITLTSEPNATIHYSWDNGTPIIYTKPIQGNEGIHSLIYYSTDLAGNSGNENRFEFKLDTIKPTTKLSVTPGSPSGLNGWYKDSPQLEFDTEPGATVFYRFTGGSERVVSSYIEMPEGENTIYYYSIDEAGNVGPEKQRFFKVDLTAPKSKIKLDVLTYNINEFVTFEASKSIDNFEVTAYYFDFGDGSYSGWVNVPEATHKYQTPGEYIVKLKVRDSAGIESEPQIATILVVEEKDEVDILFSDNLLFLVIILIVIFIMISALFVTFQRNARARESRNRALEMFVESPGLASVGEPLKSSRSTGPTGPIRSEPAEAIILEPEAVSKLQRILCSGCATTFVGDPHDKSLKCPGCGKQGALRNKLSEKKSKPQVFKCPSCSTIFKVPDASGYHKVKCPKCGITGEI